jgi:hypothetical protein
VFVIVVVTNVVLNATNVVDLQWSPSNFHIHLHQSADVLHPLKTLCHAPLAISPMEMSFVVPFTFAPLAMFLMELSFVVF